MSQELLTATPFLPVFFTWTGLFSVLNFNFQSLTSTNSKNCSFLLLISYRPSYNVAPGSYIPVLRRDNEVVGDGVVVHCMKWGLVPSFTKKTDKPDFFKMVKFTVSELEVLLLVFGLPCKVIIPL